jgi:hypothetical protein
VDSNVIEIVIRALDEASAPLRRFKEAFDELNRLNKDTASGYSQADLAAGAFIQTIGKDGVVAATSYAEAIKKAAIAVKAFIAVYVFRKLVANIAEAQDATARLDAAFRNTGDTLGATRQQLEDFATEIARTTRYTSSQAKESMAILLANEQVRGRIYERTIRLSTDIAAATGRDLRSTTMMLGRAIQDPIRGLFMLTRAQITFTAAERDAIKQLVDNGKILEARTKILDILSAKYEGTAAKLKNTLGGAIDSVTSALGDMFEGTIEGTTPAIEALNNLAEVLRDPDIKAGLDLLISAIATITSKFVELAAAIPNATRALAEFMAAGSLHGFGSAIKYGPQDLLTQAGALSSEIDNIKQRIARNQEILDNPKTLNFRMTLRGDYMWQAGYDREEDPTRFLERQNQRLKAELKEKQRLFDAAKALGEIPDYGTAGKTKVAFGDGTTTGGTGGFTEEQIRALQNIAKAAESAIQGVETESEKLQRQVTQNIESLKTYLDSFGSMSEGALRQLGMTTDEVDRAREALNRWNTLNGVLQLSPEFRAGAEAVGQFTSEVNRNIAAIDNQIGDIIRYIDLLKTLTPEARAAMEQTLKIKLPTKEEAESALFTAGEARNAEEFKNEIAGAKRALEELKTPFEQIHDKYQQMQVDLQGYLDFLKRDAVKNAEAIAQVEEAIGRIGPAQEKAYEQARVATDKWLAFQKRAAERLQDAFSNAFMEIGHGWRSFVESFLRALQQIFAEAAALRFAQLFKLDEVITKGVGAVFGGSKKTQEKQSPQQVAVEKTTQVVIESATKPVRDPGVLGDIGLPSQMPDMSSMCECLPKMTEPLKEAARNIGTTIETETKKTDETIAEGGRGLFGLIVDALKSGGQFLYNMLSRIVDAIAKAFSSSSSGGGGDWFGTLLSIGNMFAAGGGRVPANKMTLVGEEGPEWIMAATPLNVINSRQAAYAGMGGGSFEFKPNYNIVITASDDPEEQRRELSKYLQKRDVSLKREIAEMLYRNGFKRMRG